MSVVVVLHDVNNQEVEVGPFNQVCFELDVVGSSTIRDTTTRDIIVYGAGGWWFYDGHPFKQAFVKEAEAHD